MKDQLIEYMEKTILPIYNQCDEAHNMDHALKVIENSLEIASSYQVNIDMVYVIACYHDIGNLIDRKNHHVHSKEMLLADQMLTNWFTKEEINIMAEAVFDHRASNDFEPKTIYGKIVSEADRNMNYESILDRTMKYSFEKFPNYTYLQHIERAINHIEEKYGEKGYLRLWLNTKRNQEDLALIRNKLRNKKKMIEDIHLICEEKKV